MEDNQVAANMRARLVEQIGQSRFDLWFGMQTEFCVGEHALTVVTQSAFSRDWLRRNFAEEVRACCAAVTGRELHVEFEVDESTCKATQTAPACCGEDVTISKAKKSANGTQSREVRTQAGAAATKASSERRSGRDEPTLESFVVGKCNEFAFGAAMMTGRGSQQASPVLVHGITGVGKTHLLRAIRAEYRTRHPQARVLYLTAEQFVGGYVDAIRGSGLPSFRNKCRGADLLLVDDLQFFFGKASSEELLRTMDAMIAEGRQVVLASDRGLADLRPLGRAFVSRLAGGLACEVHPADYETRLGVVRRLCGELGFELDSEVVSCVAATITGGARELRGAMHRLQLVSLAVHVPMTQQLAAETLAELAQQCVRRVRLTDVEHAVCDVFGVDAAALRSERKSRSIQEPRMLAMWLARKFTRAPWSEIGEFFGRRSHSTVISAHRRVEQLMRSQAQIGVGDQTCGVEEAIRRVEAALRIA